MFNVGVYKSEAKLSSQTENKEKKDIYLRRRDLLEFIRQFSRMQWLIDNVWEYMRKCIAKFQELNISIIQEEKNFKKNADKLKQRHVQLLQKFEKLNQHPFHTKININDEINISVVEEICNWIQRTQDNAKENKTLILIQYLLEIKQVNDQNLQEGTLSNKFFYSQDDQDQSDYQKDKGMNSDYNDHFSNPPQKKIQQETFNSDVPNLADLFITNHSQKLIQIEEQSSFDQQYNQDNQDVYCIKDFSNPPFNQQKQIQQETFNSDVQNIADQEQLSQIEDQSYFDQQNNQDIQQQEYQESYIGIDFLILPLNPLEKRNQQSTFNSEEADIADLPIMDNQQK